MPPENYTPMMLGSDWILERYFGWQVVEAVPGRTKLLRKRRGPFLRNILLIKDRDEEEAALIASRHRCFTQTAWSFIQDFDARPLARWERVLPGKLREVQGLRPFGIGTYVVDLSATESALWDSMSSRTRQMCRKAQRSELHFIMRERPSEDDLACFYRLFRPLAHERQLQIPSSRALRAMSEAGDLLFVSCGAAGSAPMVVNLIYCRGTAGFYLYGARAGRGQDGSAHYAQWQTILALKAKGFRWYDLGQISSSNAEDGVAWFKTSFGGSYVAYGHALGWVPPAVRCGDRLVTAGQRLFRGSIAEGETGKECGS